MRLKRILLPLAKSHGNGFWWYLTDFWYIYSKEACVYLYRSSMESHFRNMRGVAGINKLNWPQSASVAVSEPHCTADVCSVNCLSINGRESPLYSRATTYEVFLGGYGTLMNDYMTFTYAMWPVNAKKTFPFQFCELYLFRIDWKTTSCERKNFFAIYGSFCELTRFH